MWCVHMLCWNEAEAVEAVINPISMQGGAECWDNHRKDVEWNSEDTEVPKLSTQSLNTCVWVGTNFSTANVHGMYQLKNMTSQKVPKGLCYGLSLVVHSQDVLPRVNQTFGNELDFTVFEEGMSQEQDREKDQVFQKVFT